MASPTLGAIALENYRSEDDIKLLNTIDRLRSQGLGQHISLPQLVVCGNQSSGKSSVLEAISGVPFETDDTLCSRFSTEVILRRSHETKIEVTITPSPYTNRSAADVSAIEKFHESLTSFDGFSTVYEKAKEAMGIASDPTLFSDHVLCVKISGPDRPLLTMVDLPGLFQSEEKSHGGESREQVNRMIKRYMEDPRSIILVVVSAKDDIGNQGVLSLAKRHNKEKDRIMGIITKPDTLSADSPSERYFFDLAHNRANDDVKLKLGWHVLRNRDFKTREDSREERNKKEAQFFSEGLWATATRDFVGIAKLNPTLSKVLLEKIKNELPKIMDEVTAKITECRSELEILGDERDTAKAQRQYLANASFHFHALVEAAVKGSYNDSFFKEKLADEEFKRRLRAVMENLKQEFAHTMIKNGKSQIIVKNDHVLSEPEVDNCISRDKYLEHVAKLLARSRGRELPGMFNPLIVTELFEAQAKPWESLIMVYKDSAHRAVEAFLQEALKEVISGSVYMPLWELVFNPFLSKRQKELQEKTRQLLQASSDLHPSTTNSDFTSAVQNKRTARYQEIIRKVVTELPQGQTDNQIVDAIGKALSWQHKTDMNMFACCEALDYMEAYYEIAVKRMTENIAIEVIEEGLLQKLNDVFSPLSVSGMSADLIEKIAAESPQVQAQRNDLSQKLKLLEEALELCSPYRGRTPISMREDLHHRGGKGASLTNGHSKVKKEL